MSKDELETQLAEARKLIHHQSERGFHLESDMRFAAALLAEARAKIERMTAKEAQLIGEIAELKAQVARLTEALRLEQHTACDYSGRIIKLTEALKWYVGIGRCTDPFRKPLPNPQGYREHVEMVPCEKCEWCKAYAALREEPR